MKSKRLVVLAALCGLAVLVTGCQLARWLRLLSLKKQLAKVERYVRIDDEGGLTLHFLKPVVYCDDLKLLIADETSRATNQDRIDWVWAYEKQSAGTNPEPAKFDLSFTIGFEKLKFSELRFPEQFLVLMPKPLILGLLRSAGQAEIDIKHGTAKMKWAGPGPNQRVQLPTRAQVTALLGPPFLITQSKGAPVYLYKYYQKLSGSHPPAERLAWAKFTFEGEGGEIASSEGVIGNVGWRMTRVTGEPEPRVTFALLPLSVEPVAVQLPADLTDEYIGQYQEPGGMILRLGRDGDVFVTSWMKGESGGWCAALPELTNTVFGIPNGFPEATFQRDNGGSVTGMVAQFQGWGARFRKLTNEPPATPPVVRVDPGVYEACAGQYQASWGGTVRLTCKREQLFWQNENVRARIPLYPSSETNFFFKTVESPLTFVKNERGEVTKFILHFNGKTAEAVKMDKPRQDPGSRTTPSDDSDQQESQAWF